MAQTEKQREYTFGFIQGGIGGMIMSFVWVLPNRYESEGAWVAMGYSILIGVGLGLLSLVILYPWKKFRERRLQ